MTIIKSSFIISLVFILFNSCSQKQKVTEAIILSDITNPHEMISDDKHLIISNGIEGTTICVYAIDDLTLKSKFGGSGNQLGKFMVSKGHEVGMDIRKDTLLISSHWKTSFFTMNGNYIKEFPIDKDTYHYRFLKDQYVGTDDTTVNDILYYTFNLYNSQYGFIKELTRIAGSNQGKNGLQVLVRKYQGLTYKENFYLKGKSEKFEIEVYDSNGDKTNAITHAYERVVLEEQHKNDVYKMYREHPLFGQYFDAIKERLVFPDYLPAIYKILLADEYIYVLTYESDGINTLMFMLDLNGKLVDKFNIPLKWKGATETYPFTISKNNLYQIIKNKSQEWELQIIALEPIFRYPSR